MSPAPEQAIQQAAEAIAAADALIIGAGAGMGVDSGLPDFRGTEGFWNAYPPYAKLGLDFVSMANPEWFNRDPEFAWGFYGHRLELYRRVVPHAGFAILKRWVELKPLGGFVYTSNVDGHFQRAGFDPNHILEVHGAIDGMQCLRECGIGVFSSHPYQVTLDEATMRAVPPLPACPRCGGPTRPNILMFGDWGWDSVRTDAQRARMAAWLGNLDGSRVVAIECGAGTAVPTVRRASEELTRRLNGTLVRINTRESYVPHNHIGIPLGALDALSRIDTLISPAPA